MKWQAYRFSPLATAQLDAMWDYGFNRFGEQQADRYLDGVFTLLDELLVDGRCRGLSPGRVPPDRVSDITDKAVYYARYEHHFIYFRELNTDEIGIICILGERMDTPNRLREGLVGFK